MPAKFQVRFFGFRLSFERFLGLTPKFCVFVVLRFLEPWWKPPYIVPTHHALKWWVHRVTYPSGPDQKRTCSLPKITWTTEARISVISVSSVDLTIQNQLTWKKVVFLSTEMRKCLSLLIKLGKCRFLSSKVGICRFVSTKWEKVAFLST